MSTSRYAIPPGALSATARKAGDDIARQIRQLELNISLSKGNPARVAEYQRKIEGLQQSYQTITQATQAKVVAANIAQAEQRVRAGAVGATSEAVKQQEQRAVAERQGVAVGSIGGGQINMSIGSVTGAVKQVETPSSSTLAPKTVKQSGEGLLYKVKLEDSVGVTSNIGGMYGPTKQSLPVGSAYFVLGGGEPGVFSFGKEDYRTYNVYGPQEKPERQEPRSENKPEDFFKGIYEIGVKGLVQVAVAPKPIFSDIFGTTDDKRIGKIVKQQEEFIKPAESYYSKELIPAVVQGRTPRPPSLFESGGIAFDVGTVILPTKKIPLVKLSSVKIPVATTKGMKVSRVLEVGIGTKQKSLLSVTGRAIKIGGPPKSIVKDVSPVGRGMELGSGSIIEQKILSQPEVLRLAGLSEKEIKRALTVKEIAQLVGKTKGTKVFKESLTDQPVTSLKPGKETVTAIEVLAGQQKKIRRKLGPIKGSLSGLPQAAPDLRRIAKDIDIDFPSLPGAQGVARKFVEEENLNAQLGRIFEVSPYKVTRKIKGETKTIETFSDLERAKKFVKSSTLKDLEILGGTKVKVRSGTDTEKVLELLTKEDIDQSTASLNKIVGSVYGQKAGKQTLSASIIEGTPKLKFTTLRQQTLRKAASVGSLIGPRTEGGTKIGLEVRPPLFRLQKDVYDLFSGATTFGRYADEFGLSSKQGVRLLELAEDLKRLYPDVDFKPQGITESLKIEFEAGESIASRISKASEGSEFGTPVISRQLYPSAERQKEFVEREKSPIGSIPALEFDDLRLSSAYFFKYGEPTSRASSINKLNKNLEKQILGVSSSARQSRASSLESSYNINISAPSIIERAGQISLYGRPSKASRSRASDLSIGSISIGNIRSPSSVLSPPSKPSKVFPSPVFPFTGSPVTPSGRRPPKPPSTTSVPYGYGRGIIVPTFPETKINLKGLFKIEYEQRRRRKVPTYFKENIYIAGPADILRAGVFATARSKYGTVPELRSRSPSVFKQIDKLLGKARKRKGATRPLTF